jgi:holliday junction DNA helicase RuvA
MIGRLTGKLLAKEPPLLWLDVQGVGYELEAPMSTFYRLPDTGQSLTLHTHFAVREDTHVLFGFSSAAEKALFRQLIRVSGIGPRIALAILSGITVDEFWSSVRNSDTSTLVRLPGVGRKTAERLVIELRDKAAEMPSVSRAGDGDNGTLAQAISALVNLGYRPAEAQRLAETAYRTDHTAETIIREALKRALR